MSNNNVNAKLFDSLIDSFNKYNNQLNEISNKNMQNFASLFSNFTLTPTQNIFSFDAAKTVSTEQAVKINEFIQQNMTDFAKLCETSGQITQEYKDLMMKVIDFYLQLYPSQEAYDLAGNMKKVIADSLVMKSDCNNLFQGFMQNIMAMVALKNR